ncbi:MAG TPA: plastocyanin/azurin family copper-binding protein [Candidatus Eremiobacteraceae bacterium]|nr:plastocyanin/azurin family copper-binding protein [Candidatus Eremiobacteraceae bacterium]
MSIRNRSLFPFAMLVIAIIGSLAACSGSTGLPANPGGPGPALMQPGKSLNPNTGQNWQVAVGANLHDQAFQALNFFSNSITIDQGDTITWTVGGNEHTVTFFGKRTQPFIPITKRYGGDTYDGNIYTSSGILFPGQQYTLKFTKPGTYPYECLFHDPEMAGVVIVQNKGAVYPHTQSYYDQQGAISSRHELDAAIGSLDQFPFAHGGTTLAAGIAPGLASGPPVNPTVLRFLDTDVIHDSVTIPVGTTLTWVNESNNEPHTITVPRPGHTPPPDKNPFAPPSGGNTYDGSHLVNSGPLFPGQSFSLKFTVKGTFTYYCLVHDALGMLATVTVK